MRSADGARRDTRDALYRSFHALQTWAVSANHGELLNKYRWHPFRRHVFKGRMKIASPIYDTGLERRGVAVGISREVAVQHAVSRM